MREEAKLRCAVLRRRLDHAFLCGDPAWEDISREIRKFLDEEGVPHRKSNNGQGWTFPKMKPGRKRKQDAETHSIAMRKHHAQHINSK